MPVKKDANDSELISADEVSKENTMLLNALNVAIDEIQDYNLYVAKPFDNTSETRNFIGEYIQNTAQTDFAEADERISGGEDREKVLEDYVSDKAFEEWYSEFSAGLRAASGLE